MYEFLNSKIFAIVACFFKLGSHSSALPRAVHLQLLTLLRKKIILYDSTHLVIYSRNTIIQSRKVHGKCSA